MGKNKFLKRKKKKKEALWWIWFLPPKRLFMLTWKPAWGSCQPKSIRPTTAPMEGFQFFVFFFSCHEAFCVISAPHVVFIPPSPAVFGYSRKCAQITILDADDGVQLISKRRRARFFFSFVVCLRVVGTITVELRFCHLFSVLRRADGGGSSESDSFLRQRLKQTDRPACRLWNLN